MKKYTDFGIEIPASCTSGQARTTCPECTPLRKSSNQKEKDLSVNIDERTWFCHHCGWAGGLSAGTPGPGPRPVDYPEPSLHEKMLAWFQTRGISKQTLITHRTGYKPGGSRGGHITFPRYLGGKCVAVKCRTADKTMWQDPAFPCFYNADNAVQAGGEVLTICEGEIDSLSWTEAGIAANVSVPNGAPAPNSKDITKHMAFMDDGTTENFSQFVLALDDDEPGLRLREEIAQKLGKHRCSFVTYPDGCKDANDVLKLHGPQAIREMYHRATPYPVDGLYSAGSIEDAVLELYRQGLKPGLSTGWKNLEEFYTVRDSEMTIVTGMPSSGKSTFLDALIVNLHENHGWKFCFCSPENWPIQRHVASILEKLAHKPFAVNRRFPENGRMSEEELRYYLSKIANNFFFTQLSEREMKIDSILNTMQAAISRHGVKGIVLDPWNELEHHRPTNVSETEFISSALGKIRRFARLNGVHVWIVAHPTKLQKDRKTGEYPVPRLYDIAGSAHFFNKADNGLAVHRPLYGKPLVEIHVQKVRFKEVGKPGKCWMNFVETSGTYVETTEPQPEPKKCGKDKAAETETDEEIF